MEEKEIGRVTHFFEKPSVAVIKLSSKIEVGNKLHFKGSKTDFKQEIDSIHIEHENIQSADSGQLIGLKVIEKARVNDLVFLII